MKIWAALSSAIRGWIAIVRGDADWRGHFTLSGAGLVTALLIFFFVAFLAIAISSTAVGMPGSLGIVMALLVQGLLVVALLLSALLVGRVRRMPQPLLDIMVPGTYALVAYLLLGALSDLFGDFALFALWLGLGFLLYRLAVVATAWGRGVSAAFAVLTIALLVGLPATLYMLASIALPAA
jgi:hypothetical protein